MSDILLNLDPSQLNPLLQNDGLEFIFPEGPGLKSPSFGQRVCYGTGSSYASGIALGGVWGLWEGLKLAKADPTPRRKVNTVLNTVTRRGPFLGNTLGVVAFTFTFINGAWIYFTEDNSAAATIGSAAVTGLLFKSTAGLRPMLAAGTVGSLLAGSYVFYERMMAYD
jgi:mitochondrial import inner membrane translocase subunit TIM23